MLLIKKETINFLRIINAGKQHCRKNARDTFKSILSLEISECTLAAVLEATKHKEGFVVDLLDSIILGCVISLMSICEAHNVDYNQQFMDEAIKNMKKCMGICHELRQNTN